MIALYGFSRDLGPFKGKDEAGIVAQLKDWGVDAVFTGTREVKLNGALRQGGIKIYVEKAIFFDAKFYDARPDGRPVADDGKRVKPEEWYKPLCPGQDWLRRIRLHEIKELADSGEVDGIWLDFIRYPCHWEGTEPNLYQSCFCQECLIKFQGDAEIKMPSNLSDAGRVADWILSEYPGMWEDFKCRVITSFVARVREVIGEARPEMELGLFSIPWQENDFNRAMKRIVAQDLKALAEYVDVFSPMLYHQMCDKEPAWIGEVTGEVARITGKGVLPVIQAMSTSEELSRDEFREAMETALGGESDGVIIFNLKGLVDEKRIGDFVEIASGQ